MKGNPQIIDLLNQILTHELTAINQYFLHARLCNHWGYKKLGAKIYKESIEEMQHADKLIERILYLEGLPNLQRLGKVNVGQKVLEMFQLDHEIEKHSIKTLNEGVELCRTLGDNGTRELLEHILVDSEEHEDWIDTQLNLISEIGEANYLTQQINA
jgi:bacterioferritin